MTDSRTPASAPAAAQAIAAFDIDSLPGWRRVYSGKVRDLYIPDVSPDLAHAEHALVVATDRVSAFDHLLEPGIPGKGELLTTLTLWWFDRLQDVPNHLVPDHAFSRGNGASSLIPDAVAGRAMLVKILDMYPIECVVRGYLAGSGWLEYQQSQSVCGVPLPAGLSRGDRLPEPIYTPAWKAPQGAHDENISFDRTVELVGETVAAELRDLSLRIFSRASAVAEARGIILADTKFEFGADRVTGETTLGDEVLTSDSSRYWDAVAWASGDREQSFDKQIVRDWLAENWQQTDVSGAAAEASAGAADAAGLAGPTGLAGPSGPTGPAGPAGSTGSTGPGSAPPLLPPAIVKQTRSRYRELLQRLTGD